MRGSLSRDHHGQSDNSVQRDAQSWPFFSEDEIAAVADVLRSGKVNQWTGDRIEKFQTAFCETMQGAHGLALMNGSLALELVLRTFDIAPGDEVIVPSRSFIASASSVRLLGALPVFADVDRNSGNVTPDTIRPLVTSRTKAIIAVHLAGWPCDMPGIIDLARQEGLIVIEDCAQAVGGKIDGRPLGSFGDAACFSFCQDKILTTGGEGGFLMLQDRKHWEKAWSFRDHGKDWEAATQAASSTAFRWVHATLGSNLRMTEMQAAIGLRQLEKLDGWIASRTRNAEIFREVLNSTLSNHAA